MRFTAAAIPLLISAAATAQPPAPVGLVPFTAPESAVRLERSRHKTDFFPLVNQFESQQNLGYCGPATAVIVLNTLRIDNPNISKPRDPGLFPEEYRARLPPGLEPVFSRYTQGTFFDPQTQSVKTRDQFFGGKRPGAQKPSPGLELRELGDILTAHGLSVEVHVVEDKTTDEAVRKDLIQNLATPGDFAVVNYFRPVLGQKGGGHISPLGAYDKDSDSFLILDVNPNAQKWVWVPSALLAKAMRTKDVSANRGYLLIKEGKKP
jgi:hypothetical protein